MPPEFPQFGSPQRQVVFGLFVVATWLAMVTPAFSGDRPAVVRWDFGQEETTPLRAVGGVHRDVPGPRPPDFPDFDAGNTAVLLDGNGARLVFDDPGADSPFDFTRGDAITLEAWVLVNEMRPGELVYVVGKGRTEAPGFAPDNQNWALRLSGRQGQAHVSFLFATPQSSGAARTDSHWHRWTTRTGFTPGKNWHHIAIAYRFGDSKSIRGWIDGKPLLGDWDMGGATDDAPVVDDDAVWIGSSRRGAAGNSFRGALDSVAIHRQLLDDAVLKTRFRRATPEVVIRPAAETPPDMGELPPGQTLLTLHEGFPAHDRWLNEGESVPVETLRLPTETLLLTRLPQRYDGWGIRENWKPPVLVRMAANLRLPPGQRTFLMRVRGLSRLWVNEKVIARSQPLGPSPNGEEPLTPVAKPPRPGLRVAEHRQQEILGNAEIGADGECRVVLETLVGGKALRTDPGELCVAVETTTGESFVLLQPSDSKLPTVSLTDAAVTGALQRLETALQQFDDRNRRAAAASQDAYWAKRHALARAVVAQQPPPPRPDAASHPIDAFLQSRISLALAEAAKSSPEEAREFHSRVLPILRDECFRCHGDKENGGLRLNSRAAALQGGDSETPAIVPGEVNDSELIRRIKSNDPDERMPPGGSPLSAAQIATLEAWVRQGASWPAAPIPEDAVRIPPPVDDSAFLRRLSLDTVGLPPTEAEVREFLNDRHPEKRRRVVDQLLADDRWADHWMGYWLDVLAENPTLINSSLNTTGPFRWFLYDALRDNKPFDRLVTELILLRGSPHEGGSAGFGIAGDNDAPFAAKAQIVATAFLGIEMQCARCHDSPYHSTRQRDLYSLAAMFEKKTVTVPKGSTVPAAFFETKARESLIKVTLKPGEPVPPEWPFADVTGCADDAELGSLLQSPTDSRERLAALVTSPRNHRFAQVVVNRVWRRLMGAGLVEPAHDWEGHPASHPELLNWLAAEFLTHGYDLKHLARLILTSDTWQREATGQNLTAPPEQRFFAAPDRRRLTAEQIVDSLYAAAGQTMDVEELTFDPDGRRPSSNRITLGVPHRSWMFASLANERDRPSLNLPRAQAVADLLIAFGWTGSRQNPRSDRETAPNVLQPGVLENSIASTWLTRAALGSDLADLAASAASPEQLVDSLFLRTLSRLPTATERGPLVAALSEGFAERIASSAEPPPSPQVLPRVTWSNHLRSEANAIALEMEKQARLGPPPDPRLRPEWREVYEDIVWSLINLREFVWVP